MDRVSYFVTKGLNQGMFITVIKSENSRLSTDSEKHVILQVYEYNKKLHINSLGWDEHINEEVQSFIKLTLSSFISEKEWLNRIIPMTLLSIYIESNDFKKIQIKNLLKLK